MKKKIDVGDTAPTFKTTDLRGNRLSIPSKGKWVYLSFHRFAACPFCNLRTHELITRYHQFESNDVEIVSIWPSDPEILLKHAGKQSAPFPMVSDPTRKLYADFRVTRVSRIGTLKVMLHPLLVWKALKNRIEKIEVDADPYLMPASFLIDPNGKIVLAHYGSHAGDHPDIDSVFSLLKEQDGPIRKPGAG